MTITINGDLIIVLDAGETFTVMSGDSETVIMFDHEGNVTIAGRSATQVDPGLIGPGYTP